MCVYILMVSCMQSPLKGFLGLYPCRIQGCSCAGTVDQLQLRSLGHLLFVICVHEHICLPLPLPTQALFEFPCIGRRDMDAAKAKSLKKRP